MTTTEKDLVAAITAARLTPILMDHIQQFWKKYAVLPEVVGVNVGTYISLKKELKIHDWETVVIHYKETDMLVVPFVATHKQLEKNPDTEWLFLINERIGAYESL